jgi:hypothetical protein
MAVSKQEYEKMKLDTTPSVKYETDDTGRRAWETAMNSMFDLGEGIRKLGQNKQIKIDTDYLSRKVISLNSIETRAKGNNPFAPEATAKEYQDLSQAWLDEIEKENPGVVHYAKAYVNKSIIRIHDEVSKQKTQRDIKETETLANENLLIQEDKILNQIAKENNTISAFQKMQPELNLIHAQYEANTVSGYWGPAETTRRKRYLGNRLTAAIITQRMIKEYQKELDRNGGNDYLAVVKAQRKGEEIFENYKDTKNGKQFINSILNKELEELKPNLSKEEYKLSTNIVEEMTNASHHGTTNLQHKLLGAHIHDQFKSFTDFRQEEIDFDKKNALANQSGMLDNLGNQVKRNFMPNQSKQIGAVIHKLKNEITHSQINLGEMNETEQIQWLDKTLVSVADIIKLNAITAAQKRYILEATRAYGDPSIRLDDSAESKDLVAGILNSQGFDINDNVALVEQLKDPERLKTFVNTITSMGAVPEFVHNGFLQIFSQSGVSIKYGDFEVVANTLARILHSDPSLIFKAVDSEWRGDPILLQSLNMIEKAIQDNGTIDKDALKIIYDGLEAQRKIKLSPASQDNMEGFTKTMARQENIDLFVKAAEETLYGTNDPTKFSKWNFWKAPKIFYNKWNHRDRTPLPGAGFQYDETGYLKSYMDERGLFNKKSYPKLSDEARGLLNSKNRRDTTDIIMSLTPWLIKHGAKGGTVKDFINDTTAHRAFFQLLDAADLGPTVDGRPPSDWEMNFINKNYGFTSKKALEAAKKAWYKENVGMYNRPIKIIDWIPGIDHKSGLFPGKIIEPEEFAVEWTYNPVEKQEYKSAKQHGGGNVIGFVGEDLAHLWMYNGMIKAADGNFDLPIESGLEYKRLQYHKNLGIPTPGYTEQERDKRLSETEKDWSFLLKELNIDKTKRPKRWVESDPQMGYALLDSNKLYIEKNPNGEWIPKYIDSNGLEQIHPAYDVGGIMANQSYEINYKNSIKNKINQLRINKITGNAELNNPELILSNFENLSSSIYKNIDKINSPDVKNLLKRNYLNVALYLKNATISQREEFFRLGIPDMVKSTAHFFQVEPTLGKEYKQIFQGKDWKYFDIGSIEPNGN